MFQGQSGTAFRTPRRFAHEGDAEPPTGFGVRARQRRFRSEAGVVAQTEEFYSTRHGGFLWGESGTACPRDFVSRGQAVRAPVGGRLAFRPKCG